MTQPLALVLYKRVLPGGQLVNRLQDLNYRVQTLADYNQLSEAAEGAKPMLVLVDLEPEREEVCEAIARLKGNPSTSHLPVVAFGSENSTEFHAAVRNAGATLIVSESSLLAQLPQLLEQALQLD